MIPLDPILVQAIGYRPCPRPVKLPAYVTHRMSLGLGNGHQIVLQDLSMPYVASIVLQSDTLRLQR